MRAALTSLLCLCACASARAPRELELPGVPPLAAPDPAQSPRPASLGRDAALAERFTAAGQSVEHGFEARAGELSLFSLETWGYDYGWRARASIALLDEAGRAYDVHECASGMAGFDFCAFVAPRDGRYRYRIELLEGWFRYRLARRSGYRPHVRGAPEDAVRAARIDGYLATGDDEVEYRLALSEGERVDLALRHAEAQGRAEQRGHGANVLHPVLELEQPGGGAYLVLPAGPTRECRVRVRTRDPGPGARFVLHVERSPRLCAVRGTVVDREDRPLPGVDLEFLRGADRDRVGTARTDSEGRYALELPPGPYRVRLGHWGATSPHAVDCTLLRPRTLDLVWLDEALPGETAAQ